MKKSRRALHLQLQKSVHSPTLLMFVALFCLGCVFALSQPPYGVSDEPAHTVKALATSRLQLNGPEVIGQFDYPAVVFEVPLAYSSIWHMVCYSSSTDSTPDCAPEFPSDRDIGSVSTTAGTYPPLYYFIVGQLGWISPGYTGLILMRLASVLMNSLVLAVAFGAIRRASSTAAAATAVFLAYTPTALAMGSTVNPFGLEVSCYLLIWALAGPVASHSPACIRGQRRSALLWVVSLAVAFIRPVSFIWTLSILFSLVVLALLPRAGGSAEVPARLRSCSVFASPLLVSASLSAAWWLIATPQGSYGGSGGGLGSVGQDLRYSFDRLDQYLLQLHSFFGWTEFYGPLISLILWVLSYSLFWSAQPMEKQIHAVLLGSLAVVILSPVLLEGARASSAGFGYQGRYVLPFAVGLPALLLAFRDQGLANSRSDGVAPSIFAIAATLMSTLHLLRRYSVGLSGNLLWFMSPKWEPVGGVYLQMGLLASAFLLPIVAIFAKGSSS